MAGTRGYAVSTRSDLSTEGSIPNWLVTSNGTAGNKTEVITDEEYKQLEMLVTAVCMSVALLLCIWLTCFAVEKRVQSKKRGSEKQFASQTRTYPHEVAHVRKTLMDVYDMPMIRFNMSGEDDEGASQTMIQPKKKEKEATIAEVTPDHEADGEESTSPSSSELRTETGSSSSETLAVQTGYLGVPRNSEDQEFKNWRPCLKQQLTVGCSKKSPPMSPTKKKATPPGILKKSPNTSPTRSPTRSPPMPRRSPIKSILIKRSPTLHKRWKTAVTRHFQHPMTQNHAVAAAPPTDAIEMKTVNGLNNVEPQAPKRSILKHGSRWRALAPKLVPMVKAEELDDDVTWDGDDTKHQVVIKCEIHHEDERRETDPDSDEKVYTEKSPLTRSIRMVLEPRLDAPTKKNSIEWRCEDFDGVPCTDV
ncbi:uncharacterized protein LOC117306907 [Asterias rubens]|uniref:uncharacterized protein LOC117306907 n=1 Tax=Asterias rubens TaxID=7604 RepID=UPI001455404B|nr:uncharacterized protein LOC117306907 [Asterias rubens]